MPGAYADQSAEALAPQPYPEATGQSAGASQPQPYRAFDEKEIVEIFSYHPPTPDQRMTYERINAAFIDLAIEIAPFLPDGPGKTAAIRKLADARMAANAAVALGGKF
jgi:hypothetical protein